MRNRVVPVVSCAVVCVALFAAFATLRAATPSAKPQARPTTRPVPTHWVVPSPMLRPTTQRADLGPDVVVMKELVHQYEAVTFNHKTHAVMAEMWDGCETCHHRSPTPTTRPANTLAHDSLPHTQEASAEIPACKSCHPASAEETIELPNLKGAYHRQCLNCHREWMHENACAACHEPRLGPDGTQIATRPTTGKGDIVGRMHPPTPEPDVIHYRTRVTPAVGANAVFRHKEHTADYGLRCVSCHRNDNCSHCHDARNNTVSTVPAAPTPTILKPGRTWKDSHGPCIACHQEDHCRTCHYKDNQSTPPPFDHASTGQALDKDHHALTCFQCHSTLKSRSNVTCGDATCHKPELAIAYPLHRPGPQVALPSTRPVAKGPTKGITR